MFDRAQPVHAVVEPVARGAATRHHVQRRLAVGAADDPLEVEADRVAEDVMRGLRRAPEQDGAAGLIASGRSSRIARRTFDDPELGPQVGRDGGDVSADLANRIRSASDGGPLPARTLSRMEAGFGASFGQVRVHPDSPLPREVTAEAFTVGTDVHFAPGAYSPGTAAGERLLAHELTHVVQQGGAIARHVADDERVSTTQTSPSRIRRRDDGPSGDEPAARVSQRPAGPAVVRRGFFDDVYNTIAGLFGPSKAPEPSFPKVVTISGEKVSVDSDAEQAEAEAIIAGLEKDHGITLSSAATIEGIRTQYSKVMATEIAKLQASVWKMKELRALKAAISRFAPILGGARADSTLSDRAQGVTTLGKLKGAIDVNSATGKVDNTTMGEYFGGKQNVGFFDTVTDVTDSRYVAEGKSGPDNATTLEANAIHEMAHGLIQPTELTNWISAMDFWTDRYTPSGKKGAEVPPTKYGQTGGAAEDLCESVAIFFTNQPKLKQVAPQREAFLAKMVAGWPKPKATAVLETTASATGTGE